MTPDILYLHGFGDRGGLLAAILASQQPERIANVLLLAPAIDNFTRNYEGRSPHDIGTWNVGS